MKKQPRNLPPKIVIEEVDGMHCLMTISFGMMNPAGWRLQKGEPLPISEFEFFDELDAKVACMKLQEYVDRL